jgi:hypothetical protein
MPMNKCTSERKSTTTTPKTIEEKKIKLADILLVGGILAFGCILGLVVLLTSKDGNLVQVRVDGTIIESFQMNENLTYNIDGVNGGTNLLIIQDGEVWIDKATCPDGLCKNTGKVSQVGQSIICLPNKVVVEILNQDGGQTATPEVDVIAR